MTSCGRVPIVFMGSDPIALPFLRALEQRVPQVELRGIFTQPDRPRGRGQKLQANEVKQWAQSRGLWVRQPERCGPPDEAWLRTQGIELVLVMAYGQILRPSFIGVPPRGIYNLHTSLLPRYRGASPIHTALACGESVTGVTLMEIIPEMDAGGIVAQETVAIGPTMTAPELIEALAHACLPLVQRALPGLLEGTVPIVPQDAKAATYCRRIFKEDGVLDFNAAADVLDRRIRAFQPWPGASFTYRQTPLRVGSARVVDGFAAAPGTIHLGPAGHPVIACSEGALELLELQRPGGRMLPIAEFLRGFDLVEGARAEGQPLAPLVGRRPFPWRWRPGDSVDGLV